MKVFFLGNCQISRLSMVFKSVNSELNVTYLSNTGRFGQFEEDRILEELSSADLVVSQPIVNEQNSLNFARVGSLCRGRVCFVPYVYLDGIFSLSFAPQAVVDGKSGYIYGEKIIEAFVELNGAGFGRIKEALLKGEIDFENLKRFKSNLAELRNRESRYCDVMISDFILGDMDTRCPMISHNHPSPFVILEIYRRVSELLNLKPLETFDYRILEKATLPETVSLLSPFDVESLQAGYNHDLQWSHKADLLLRKYFDRCKAAVDLKR